MTDGPIKVLNDDGTPNESNDLVQRDELTGDPIADPKAVRMIEVESIERVVEGLKIAADACAQLSVVDGGNRPYWNRLKLKLDTLRKAAVQVGGLGLTVNETNTLTRDTTASYFTQRTRLYEGLKQAAGGMRQLATCFRADFVWSRMATTIEDMRDKVKSAGAKNTSKPMRSLWMPGGRS